MSARSAAGPLPRYRRDGEPVASNELLEGTGHSTLEAEALGELLLGGAILSGSTLISGVRRCLDWGDELVEEVTRHEDPTGDVLGAMSALLEDMARGQQNPRWLLALSGGMDARILAGILAPWRPTCLTFGWNERGPDGPDEPEFASAVAKQLGLVHHRRMIRSPDPLEVLQGPDAGSQTHLRQVLGPSIGGGCLADLLALPSHSLDTDADLLFSGFGGDALLGPARRALPEPGGYTSLLDPLHPKLHGLIFSATGITRARERLEAGWSRKVGLVKGRGGPVATRRLLDLLVRQQFLNAPGLATRNDFVEVAAPYACASVVRAALAREDESDQRPALLARINPSLAALPVTPWGLPPNASFPLVAGQRKRRRRRLRWDRWLARMGLRPRPDRGAVVDIASQLRGDTPLSRAVEQAVEPSRWEGLPGLKADGPQAVLTLHRQGYRNCHRPLMRFLLAAGMREQLEGPTGTVPLLPASLLRL